MISLRFLLSFILSTPLILAQTQANDLNMFALDFYQVLSQEDANLFFSPYGVYSALGMVYAGAAGETAQEFEDVLRMSQSGEAFHQNLRALNETLASTPDDAYEFTTANALWARPEFPIEEAFLNLTRDYYGAEQNDSFDAATINAWAAENTNDLITKIVGPGDVESADTILTNAVYFLGVWEQAFDEAQTLERPFYGFDKEYSAPLMTQTLNTLYLENEQMQAVDLAYKGSLSLLMLMPKETGQAAFEKFEAALDTDFSEFVAGLAEREVQLLMPKFELELGQALNAPLHSLGLVKALDANADFSSLSPAPLSIDSIFHQAYVRVDEKGTEAAAVTTTTMITSVQPAPPTFRADRPFIFMIRDRASGAILFMGRLLELPS